MNSEEVSRLERKLNYEFSDKSWLLLALTHRSYGSKNNERLEFLGDSIVNFVIADVLYERFPAEKEGPLSRLRACMVCGVTLAEIGREFELGDVLRLGSGELKSGGYRRQSILADAVEAIIGAISLDSDINVCRSTILSWFDGRLNKLSIIDEKNKDPKTRLQEYLQARKQPLPQYSVTGINGESHDLIFTVACELKSINNRTVGTDYSRRGAEQQAARKALELVNMVS
ncbi:MAG: ribonuclease III [Candidatus Endonucleobacter bathymodioli]|uniref:Ribonuclease 3 n=1 Tax=Candidatus Endonucleibacter bathymodioli TaxID=539814 RepID=A0AA90NJJ1_9GAMM|nr:ribonuclease III [Candidatus Endonucleobacter bathymodioli]